tara:strand:- start:1638 stop:1940 length:303 start_codon:yes stop_codon:yes gene_type:complete
MIKDKRFEYNDDILICELQHDLEEYKNEVTELVNEVKYSDGVIKNLVKEVKKGDNVIEKLAKESRILWDIVTEICEDSNPSYLYDMRIKAEEKIKEIHNG